MGRVKLSAKKRENGVPEYTVALAGNPNVGKSTLFNSLTGMHAHTGNWAGKTVECESALCRYEGAVYRFVDIPGTYSLLSHSDEEEIARSYIAFGGADLVVVVADALALEQNLNLVMQICECGINAILCINFLGAAKKRGVTVDVEALSAELGIPVVGADARKPKSLGALMSVISKTLRAKRRVGYSPKYSEAIESAADGIAEGLSFVCDPVRQRWLALRLLESDKELRREIFEYLSELGADSAYVTELVAEGERLLFDSGISSEGYADLLLVKIVSDAERICKAAVSSSGDGKNITERVDKILTGRIWAYPFMIALLVLVLFITLSLASYPSALLGRVFAYAETLLIKFFSLIGSPWWLSGALVGGLFRTVGQVVAVMLPPMAIFFPLFALLEDSGYLPRIAYNLDRPFACAGACGKQALTMCMGLGCNAVGICGARIIDSKREKMLAILTNAFVPCNGRLPMLITLISLICLYASDTAPTALVALVLAFLIVISVAVSFGVTALLSKTLLKGERSAFTIELPPYRKPQFLKVIAHSLTDKCLSVLSRAVTVAAPMGILIWIFANLSFGDGSILSHVSDFLAPIGRFFGMDGVILLAFIIGIPANEIVIPIMLLLYSSGGVIPYEGGIEAIRVTFLECGWTPITAVCALAFALFHWPCSTSLLTVYKETKSFKATLLSFVLPTAAGLIFCLVIRLLATVACAV